MLTRRPVIKGVARLADASEHPSDVRQWALREAPSFFDDSQLALPR